MGKGSLSQNLPLWDNAAVLLEMEEMGQRDTLEGRRGPACGMKQKLRLSPRYEGPRLLCHFSLFMQLLLLSNKDIF